MFCKNCGLEMDSNAKFCSKCGTPRSMEQAQVRKVIEAVELEEVKPSKFNKKEKVLDKNKLIKEYEKEMKEAAKNLQFERAAELRDIIKELKKDV